VDLRERRTPQRRASKRGARRDGIQAPSLRRSRGLAASLTPPSWRYAPKGEGSWWMLIVAPRCAALEIILGLGGLLFGQFLVEILLRLGGKALQFAGIDEGIGRAGGHLG